MTFQQTTSFKLDPRNNPNYVFLGRTGGTPGDRRAGRSSGPHLHFEHRDLNGNLLDPETSGALADVVFQKPNGEFAFAKRKNDKGKWEFDPDFIITGRKGEDRGTHKHAGTDAALQAGSAIYLPKSLITGNIRTKFDPGGYGLHSDFSTKNGSLLFAHMNDINKFTPGAQGTTTDQGEVATAAPTQTSSTTQQTSQPGTTLNMNIDLGSLFKKKESNFADTYVASMLQGLMKQPDYISQVMDADFFA
jgi:hypothetical protein